jgi:hypothetical protein
MYYSRHGHPIPEIADLDNTPIPEPMPPSSDEAMVALIPLSPERQIVMTAVYEPEIMVIKAFAESKGIPLEDVSWFLVDLDELQAVLVKHLMQYHKDQFVKELLNHLDKYE